MITDHEKARLLRLAKARGWICRRPRLHRSRSSPPRWLRRHLLVTDDTTDEELSAFIRGKPYP